jgi:hypothetical protein
MVTPQHEALHRIFRHDGELFARTVRHVLHEDVPTPIKVEILDTDMTETRPHIRRGDSVLLAEFLAEDAKQRYIIIVESQLRQDGDKDRRWPYYIAYMHEKYECPVVLVVVCNDTATAKWARNPIRIGLPHLTSMTVTAWVLGPDNLGAITEVEQAAADPGLAVLAAITHSQSPEINDILEALADALQTIDTSTAEVLAELTAAGLANSDGLPIWRALMTTRAYPYHSPMRDWYREEGRVEGLQQAILRVLEARRMRVPDETRELILACRDDETLTKWLRRATLYSDLRHMFTPIPE